MVVPGREVDHPLEQRGRAVAVVQEVPHVIAGRVQLILAVDAQKLFERSANQEVESGRSFVYVERPRSVIRWGKLHNYSRN